MVKVLGRGRPPHPRNLYYRIAKKERRYEIIVAATKRWFHGKIVNRCKIKL